MATKPYMKNLGQTPSTASTWEKHSIVLVFEEVRINFNKTSHLISKYPDLFLADDFILYINPDSLR